jgi:hypothetical protein
MNGLGQMEKYMAFKYYIKDNGFYKIVITTYRIWTSKRKLCQDKVSVWLSAFGLAVEFIVKYLINEG